MDRKQLEILRQESERYASGARERIEVAIEKGEIPTWVLDACNVLEFSSLSAGAARARLKDTGFLAPQASTRIH